MRTFHGVTLSWETVEHVIEVTLHRGPCNEIGTTMLRELELLAEHLDSGDHGAGALLWTSSRRGFSAGADLRELYEGLVGYRQGTMFDLARSLVTREAGDAPLLKTLSNTAVGVARRGRRALVQPLVTREIRRFLHRIHAVFDAFDMADLVTVAALHGPVFGGGFELALTADVRIADRTARFAFPELRLGIIPGFGGIPRLEREVGNGVVRDLLLTGRSLNAKRAHALGVVSQVTSKGDHVGVARRTARQACRFDRHVSATAKAFVKKLPRERLDEEIETFLTLIRAPGVEQALARFVAQSDERDPHAYLP